MYKNKKIIALIPARGGSIGIKRKNIKNLLGLPLIYWSIDAARDSKYIDDFYISTEDMEIGTIALLYEAKVLWRPKELAQNDSHIKDVIKYHIEELRLGNDDLLILLNPTSPLRIINNDFNLIDYCLEQFDPELYDQAASGYMCRNFEWGDTTISNRQQLSPFFYDDGNIYVHSPKYILEQKYFCDDPKRRKAIVVPNIFNREIDTPIDWIVIETLIKHLQEIGSEGEKYLQF